MSDDFASIDKFKGELELVEEKSGQMIHQVYESYQYCLSYNPVIVEKMSNHIIWKIKSGRPDSE